MCVHMLSLLIVSCLCVSARVYLLVCVKWTRVDVKRERERETEGDERNAQRIYIYIYVWHRNVHSAACRQALNDKKEKTDARKAK